MSGPSVALSPRAELASRVAELNDLVLFGEFSDAELASMSAAVDGLLADSTSGRPPWWESVDADRAYRARSPFAGVENPRAPALRFTADGDAPSVVGEVTLDKAFAGPPGAVHGGVLAGLFDEVIGAAASRVEPSRVVVTAKLSVRYRADATPLRTPLRLEATVTRRTSRCIIVEAECLAAADVTATAEALMVLR